MQEVSNCKTVEQLVNSSLFRPTALDNKQQLRKTFAFTIKQPEKTTDISQRHHWFPRKMTSLKSAQKFHTDDASLPRSGQCFRWVEANFLPALPIRSTSRVRVVMRHQYGISILVSQTSFRGETSGGVAKCRLFSQAKIFHVSIFF